MDNTTFPDIDRLFRERVSFVIFSIVGMFCLMQMMIQMRTILEPLLWAIFLILGIEPLVTTLQCFLSDVLYYKIYKGGKRLVEFCINGCNFEERTPPHDINGGSPSNNLNTQTSNVAETTASLLGIMGNREEEGIEMEISPSGRAKRRHQIFNVDDDDDGKYPIRTSHAMAILQEYCPSEIGESSNNTVIAGGGNEVIKLDSSANASIRIQILCSTLSRILAVTLALLVVLTVIIGCGLLIFQSGAYVKNNWQVYQEGARRITEDTQKWLSRLFEKVPHELAIEASAKLVKAMEGLLYSTVEEIINSTAHLVIEIGLVMLYLAFWLSAPIPISPTVNKLFRRYIFLKSVTGLGYGLCVSLLLWMLKVDMYIVFGLIAAFLTFVPEIGSIVSMLLPIPMILFDSRIDRPINTAVVCIVAQLGLKMIFANIIEVKLIHSDQIMKMHPVIILLSVAFFGFLWGPTGMLLSVPLMVIVKLSVIGGAKNRQRIIPDDYRNFIISFLEGGHPSQTHSFERRRNDGDL